jgi:hypothetical protein
MAVPIDNTENMKNYLMRCTEQRMRLLEDFDDNGFIYERGSIVLKGYFFQETHQNDTHVHFQDYPLDVTSCQYSHLVCAARIKLIEVQSEKKKKS